MCVGVLVMQIDFSLFPFVRILCVLLKITKLHEPLH